MYTGAYELTRHEHQLQNKLNQQLKKLHKLQDSIGFSVASSQLDTQSRAALERTKELQEQESLFEESTDALEQELHRIKKNTISLTETSQLLQQSRKTHKDDKASAFYNARYFDRRFDEKGNMMLQRNQNLSELGSEQGSVLRKAYEDPIFGDKSQRSRSNLHGPSKVSFIGSQTEQVALKKAKREMSVTGFWAQDQPGFVRQEDFDRQCRLFNLPSKTRERELLYKWAPGTRRKPTSDQFQAFFSRYENNEAREREKKRKKQRADDLRYHIRLAEHNDATEVKMAKREKRLMKA